MTDKQVARYIRLASRKTYILVHSGKDWKPEYGPELERINKELTELRPLVDQEHKKKALRAATLKAKGCVHKK